MSSPPDIAPNDAAVLLSLNPYRLWRRWQGQASGQQLLLLEQAWLDHQLADVFGYSALAVSPPGLRPLATNRMPFRGRIHFSQPLLADAADATEPSLVCEPDALPIGSESIDLLVLAHALEFVEDPHALLREAERVLIPEGRLVILGLNPFSLWALHRPLAAHLFPPVEGRWISLGRIKDWCRLLGFSIEGGRFGIYRPVCQAGPWWSRLDWLEQAGSRWWPSLGAVYGLTAVKRRRGMRLITPEWSGAKAEATPSAAISSREGCQP